MIRLFISLLLFFNVGYAQKNINAKIQSTSSEIKSFSRNYTTLNKKLAKNAKAILKQFDEILLNIKKKDSEKYLDWENK